MKMTIPLLLVAALTACGQSEHRRKPPIRRQIFRLWKNLQLTPDRSRNCGSDARPIAPSWAICCPVSGRRSHAQAVL